MKQNKKIQKKLAALQSVNLTTLPPISMSFYTVQKCIQQLNFSFHFYSCLSSFKYRFFICHCCIFLFFKLVKYVSTMCNWFVFNQYWGNVIKWNHGPAFIFTNNKLCDVILIQFILIRYIKMALFFCKGFIIIDINHNIRCTIGKHIAA